MVQLKNEPKEKNKDESGKNALLYSRLKAKEKEYKDLEKVKQQLERELVEAKKKATLVDERYDNEELKKQIDELKKEMNGKVEQLQQKDIKIKCLEEQLLVKGKYIFDMEASTASVQREKERLSKEMEEKEKESDKNIADATQRIDELEQKHQEQLKEFKEENKQLRVSNCVIIMTCNDIF